MKYRGRTSIALARRSPLALLALFWALVGCSGDDQTFRTPPIVRGLAVEDFGLTPSDPAPLDDAVAWAVARDATALTLRYVGVRSSDLADPAFDPAAQTYEVLDLTVQTEEDPRGFRQWEAPLPLRGDDEALLYFFEAAAPEDSLEVPAGGAVESVQVAAQPIVIDFPWPAWPQLSQEMECDADRSRVFDGAEDEATLAGAFPFEEIRNPEWLRSNRSTIIANLAGVTHGIGVEWGGESYFFPIAIMLWNEVSNQRLGNLQTAMSYCPLTDTALLFDTGFDPEALPKAHFYTPAGLFNSNLMVVVDDRRADRRSIFGQMLGFAFTGPETGTCLKPLPSYQIEYHLWLKLHPDTWILNGDPALASQFDYLSRDNPYSTYWRTQAELRAPVAHDDGRLPRKAPVLGILGGADPVAIAMGRTNFVHHTSVAGLDVVVFQQRRTAIALERRHPTTGAPMRFTQTRGSWRGFRLYRDDSVEPSLWTMEGVAIAGPLKGARLAWMPSMKAFWFAWYAIYPETRFEVPDEI
jgi:Protein of unknown function (DUF3179)